MIVAILTHTPLFVWALLAVLLVAGLRQRHAHRRTYLRALLLPAAMAALSLLGARTLAGAAPWLAWLASATLGAALMLRRPLPAATQYDPLQREFYLPGSNIPLVLMLATFVLNYAVNVLLAMRPALRDEVGAGVAICVLCGLLSGLFIGRAARLWRLAGKTGARSEPALH